MPTLYSGIWHRARLPPPQALLFSHRDESKTLGMEREGILIRFLFPAFLCAQKFHRKSTVSGCEAGILGWVLEKRPFFHSNVQRVNSVLRHPECERYARFEQ